MKVSVESIIGSAQKIKGQKNAAEDGSKRQKGEIKTDSVSINAKINSRLDGIENELHSIQSALTRNQIIRSGINQIQDNFTAGRGGGDIVENITFEGKKVLKEFIGKQFTPDKLDESLAKNSDLISKNIKSLKSLQVELDNFMASNLSQGKRSENILQNVNSIFPNGSTAAIENISRLQPDTVMKLLK